MIETGISCTHALRPCTQPNNFSQLTINMHLAASEISNDNDLDRVKW